MTLEDLTANEKQAVQMLGFYSDVQAVVDMLS